jgi:G patch domain-containing protein 1
MGWRPGQGVGPRVSRKIKKDKTKSRNEDEIDKPTIVDLDNDVDMEKLANQRVYGCQIPAEFAANLKKNTDSSSDDEDIDVNVLYAPEDVSSPLCNPKENSFGLGYKGLDRMTATGGHIDLFGGNQLKFRGSNSSNDSKSSQNKNKGKTVNITGEVQQ